MAITPDEILHYQFTKKGSRAYLSREVDDFLDRMHVDYAALSQQNHQLTEENARLQLKLNELESQREQVNQSILVAQAAADRLKAETDDTIQAQMIDAQTAAAKIIDDAKRKAEVEADRLATENKELIDEQNYVRQSTAAFKASFLEMIREQELLLADDKLTEAVALLPLGAVTEARTALPVVDPEVGDADTSLATDEEPAAEPVVVLPEATD